MFIKIISKFLRWKKAMFLTILQENNRNASKDKGNKMSIDICSGRMLFKKFELLRKSVARWQRNQNLSIWPANKSLVTKKRLHVEEPK
jgi:hypothetical protein